MGSRSSIVTLPTTVVAFARYGRDQGFVVLRATGGSPPRCRPGRSPAPVAAGMLVGVVPDVVLLPVLAGLLLSAVEFWRHRWCVGLGLGKEAAGDHPGTEEVEDQAPPGRSRRPRGR